MTSAISTSKSNQNCRLNDNQVHELLVETTVTTIKEIAADNKNRIDHKDSIEQLAKGIFYMEEYFKALGERNQTARIDWFKNKNSFFNGYLSHKHFDPIPENNSVSGKKVCCFVIKNNVLPSDALREAKEGLSLLGCGEVCQIAQYCAIKAVLGDDKFNALFAANTKTPLIIGNDDRNPIGKLRNYMVIKNASASDIKKGDVVYVQNAGTYLFKFIKGEVAGFNMICVEESFDFPKCTSLGLNPDGNTFPELDEILISEYNKERFDIFQMYSEKTGQAFSIVMKNAIANSEQLKNTQITLENFKEQDGGKIQVVCELHFKRIAQLASSNLKKARNLLDTYEVNAGKRL